MRTGLVLTLLSAALLALSCSGPDPVGPEPDGPDGPGPVVVSELPQSKELAGMTVEETEAGPWTLRRTVREDARGWARGAELMDGGPGAPAEGAAERPSGEIAVGGGAGGAFGGRPGGAPPPPGAPEPMGGDAEPMPTTDAPMDSADDSPVPRRRTEAQGGAPLKAGATDDNEDYDAFLEFLAKWGDRPDTVEGYQYLDVADRRWIRVVNREGKPVPAARVSVVDVAADRVALRATTYGDGRAPFYPHLGLEPGAFAAADGSNLLVEVAFGESRERVQWDGASDLTVAIDAPRPVGDEIALDVMLLIDTTGSMSDEIGRIKASLLGMTAKLRSLEREFDLRFGAVLYRDLGDEYVTKSHPFTADIEAFDAALQTIRADGGGDGPESLNQGLAEGIGRADWRDGAAKVMFLIADAPPHMDYEGDVPYGESLKAAVAGGIRVHSVAASGLPAVGSLVFRQVAQFTRGKFIFIQYGSIADSAASHGVAGATKSNNLDDILFEQIREEVARWGRDRP